MVIVDKAPPSRQRHLPPAKRKKLVKKLKESYKLADMLESQLEQYQQQEATEAEKLLKQNEDLFIWEN